MKAKSLSGKFVLRISQQLHEALCQLAQNRGQSLNGICQDLLLKGVKKQNENLTDQSNPIVGQIRKVFPTTRAIILFGSQARGEATAISDTDILIILDKRDPISRNLYHLWDEKIATDEKISPQFVSLLDDTGSAGSIWLEAALEGIVLWETENHPVSRLFFLLRKEIMRGTWQRKMAHGSPYWIKQGRRRAA